MPPGNSDLLGDLIGSVKLEFCVGVPPFFVSLRILSREHKSISQIKKNGEQD